EALYPNRVVRGPNLPGDPSGIPGPVVFLDTSYMNIASTRVEAFDFQLNYTRDIGDLGQINVYAVATHQTAFAREILPGSGTVDSVGFEDGPLEWRGNVGATFKTGQWEFGWNAQYFDSYSPGNIGEGSAFVATAVERQGGRIPSQIYHDL